MKNSCTRSTSRNLTMKNNLGQIKIVRWLHLPAWNSCWISLCTISYLGSMEYLYAILIWIAYDQDMYSPWHYILSRLLIK